MNFHAIYKNFESIFRALATKFWFDFFAYSKLAMAFMQCYKTEDFVTYKTEVNFCTYS